MNVDDFVGSLNLASSVAENDKEPEMRYVVRVTTSAWRDKGGFHYKKSIRRMERKTDRKTLTVVNNFC